jgi:membrane fusion protein, multidrug efflux system
MKAVTKIPATRLRRWRFWAGGLAGLALVIGGGLVWHSAGSRAPAAAPPAPVPVSVSEAVIRDVPILIGALGTVQAWRTVAVHSQIDGPVQSVDFTEGQEVKKGDTLAMIDPRPLKAALDQAIAKKAQDEAQLIAADKDLARFKSLGSRGFDTQQNIDQQQGKVDQLKATVQADDAAIEAAQLQLAYATIKAPIDGRVGFRQLDPGNIVHANDPNPITVLTQTRPIDVVFTLPQNDLGRIREAMLRGAVPALAYDQDDTARLAEGTLRLIDNQIDQTTSTIRLKATFPNEDGRLWPGEFVHLRIHVDTKAHAVTIPQVAVQRGPQGYYAWVVKSDNTVEMRPIDVTPVDTQVAIADNGLSAGDRVVVNGQSRLQPATRVDTKTAGPVSAASGAS